ncbi:hypothetical protein E4U40_003936 [Claviceps sp. LM458 group G5]|nr:hypothetical protein E4U40_003936 [Claviceps sp. LM458 group G5]
MHMDLSVADELQGKILHDGSASDREKGLYAQINQTARLYDVLKNTTMSHLLRLESIEEPTGDEAAAAAAGRLNLQASTSHHRSQLRLSNITQSQIQPPTTYSKADRSTNTMASDTATEPRVATREEMREARLPLAYRDSCAHLLIPLNKCRKSSWYLPWKCEDERHSYEKCQYVEFKKRVAKMDELRASKGGARSN